MRTEILMSDLPSCILRMGAVMDGKLEVACGRGIVEPVDCIRCGGFKEKKGGE